MVLSDRTIKEQMLAGRIRIEPCDPDDIQPSSVDLHLGAHFQVFRNSRYPYIDPSREQAGLMELVECDCRGALRPAPRRVRPRHDSRADRPARRPRGAPGRQVLARATRSADPLDCRLRRPGLGRPADARAVERREPADRAHAGDGDRPDILLPDDTPVDRPYGTPGLGSKYQGQTDVTPSRFENFRSVDARRLSAGSKCCRPAVRERFFFPLQCLLPPRRSRSCCLCHIWARLFSPVFFLPTEIVELQPW